MKSLEVNVTQENIDNGQHMTCTRCPIARAINTPDVRIFPQNIDASVHLKDGWFTHREKQGVIGFMYAFEMPAAATAFIEAFQRKQKVEPFSFTLKLRPKGQRLSWSGTT